MFMAEGYPREEYLEVPEGSVEFPKEICIAYAVCSNNCGNAETDHPKYASTAAGFFSGQRLKNIN